MNRRGESNAGGGVGFFGILLAVFIALKLAKVVTWSWWVVFSPLWIELGLIAIILLIVWLNDFNNWRF